MWLLNQAKRQLKNAKTFKAFPILKLPKIASRLLIDYGLRNGKSQLPLNISWYITMRCNLRCSFCFLSELLNKNQKELTFPEIKRFIKQIAKIRPSIYITGGEPLLRKDLIKIVQELKKHKLSVGINTNAVLLTKEKADQLIKAGIDYLIVSIDGPRKVHDKLRGVKGTFEKATDNLRYFCKKKSKTRVLINAVITKDNLDYLDYLVDYVKEVGADELTVQHLIYLTRKEVEANKPVWREYFGNDKDRISYYMTSMKKHRKKILETVRKLKKKAKQNHVTLFFKPDLTDHEILEWYNDKFRYGAKCFYPWGSLRLGADGTLYPCPTIFRKLGNIRDGALKDVWNNDKYIEFRRALKKEGQFPICARCCKL